MEVSVRISQSPHWDMAPATEWSGSVANPKLSCFGSSSHRITAIQDPNVHTLSIPKQGGSWRIHRGLLREY
jgi:hypothetical protein